MSQDFITQLFTSTVDCNMSNSSLKHPKSENDKFKPVSEVNSFFLISEIESFVRERWGSGFHFFTNLNF